MDPLMTVLWQLIAWIATGMAGGHAVGLVYTWLWGTIG